MPERRRYERTPDSVAILTAAAVAGVVVLLSGVHPPSMVTAAGLASAIVWAAVFAAGAALSLLGLLWAAPIGWAIELAGRIPLAVTSAGYVWALWQYATNLGAVIVVAIVAALAVASGVRAFQVAVRIIRYRASMLGGRT